MFVYTLEPLPSIQPIGCYHDKYDDRALPVDYANFRSQIIWTRMNLTVNQCAQVAFDRGYEYFSVQFYGECFGGEDAGTMYSKYGKSGNCWVFNDQNGHAVGSDLTNFVYQFQQDDENVAKVK